MKKMVSFGDIVMQSCRWLGKLCFIGVGKEGACVVSRRVIEIMISERSGRGAGYLLPYWSGGTLGLFDSSTLVTLTTYYMKGQLT